MATASPLSSSRVGKGHWEWGNYRDVSPRTDCAWWKSSIANEGHAPGTFAPLPLGNMKPVIYSFQWLMLFHPQRRRPIITCHTSNSSPSALRAALKLPPAPYSKKIDRLAKTAWGYCGSSLLVGKNIPRWWKIDSNEMRQRRLLFQGLVRGTGRCRLIIPVHITRSYSCKSPTLPDRNACFSAPRLVFLPVWLWLTNVMQLSSQSKLGETPQCSWDGGGHASKQGNLPGAPHI